MDIIKYNTGPNIVLSQSNSDSIVKSKDYPKLSKATSGYLELAQFVDAELDAGYFCNSCMYFLKESQECAIVKSSGPDIDGEDSGTIAPYGVCTLWMPNEQAR
jgi:hypothetical protein